MVEYQTVASVSNEAPGEMKLGVLDDKEVVVANIDGEDFAFGNACPHAASPLVDGEVVGAIVTCRWYATAFNELLQAWAMNLMVINVSTRKYARAVRLPDDAGGDLPAASGDATSKSAVSRRFVALTRSKLKAWLASPLDDLDLVVLQIDGLHVGDHLMVAAIGIDTGGAKHVLGLAEGATENAATVQAMLDNLIERGKDWRGPTRRRHRRSRPKL